MTRAELFEHLERRLEAEPGSLKGPEELATLPGWDSLTLIHLSIFAERTLGVRLTVKQLADCRSVQELVDILAKQPRR